MIKMQWYRVQEHLPPETDEWNNPRWVLAYSAVHHAYNIARFCPVRGWLSQDAEHFHVVTHWLDFDLPLPYPIADEIDYKLAKSLGFNVSDLRAP